MNSISSFQGPQNRAYRARVQYCKKKNLTKWRRRRRKKKEEEEEEESDKEDGGLDRSRGTPRSKNFKKEIPRRIRISDEEEEEYDDSLISKFQVSIWATITALIRCLGLLILLWVCWFCCGFAWIFGFVVGLLIWLFLQCSLVFMFFVVFGFVEWVLKSSFCWVSIKIESIRRDFNLTENESAGLESSIPKWSLLHSRC